MKNDLIKAFELSLLAAGFIPAGYSSGTTSSITQPGIQRINNPKLLQEMLDYNPYASKKEDPKYFTPSIEDLHVGYECEVLPINESLGWEAGKLSYYSGHEGPGLYNLYPFWYTTRKSNYGRIKTMIHDFKQIRVPYLTKEQVEKEGWIERIGLNDFYKNDYRMLFGRSIEDNNVVKSTHLHVYHTRLKYILYEGSCPSINEFRTIMKLLNIK